MRRFPVISVPSCKRSDARGKLHRFQSSHDCSVCERWTPSLVSGAGFLQGPHTQGLILRLALFDVVQEAVTKCGLPGINVAAEFQILLL